MKKNYLTHAIALALGSFSLGALAQDSCIGQNPVFDSAVENVELPQLELGNAPPQLIEGETLLLSAFATIDSHSDAKASFYWCSDKGVLNALGNPNTNNLSTVDATANLDSIDFSSIEFIAPAVAEEGDNIRIEVKLSDGLGYNTSKIVELQINDSGNTDNDDPAPVVQIDTPDNMIAGSENRISFSVSDKNKDGSDNSAKLSTDLYYQRDGADFVRFARDIEGEASAQTWTPELAGTYKLKLVSTDGNKQAEALSGSFAVNDNDSIRELLKNIVVTPVNDNGEAIIGGEIEIVINTEIVVIIDDNNDGKYEIPSAYSGNYEINVRNHDRRYPSQVIRLQAMPNDDPDAPPIAAEVHVTMDQAPTIDTVTISPRNSEGQIIINASIEIVIDGQRITVTDNGDGLYQVPAIREGRHEVRITQGDYVYPTTEVVIDSNTSANTPVEPQIPPPFNFDDNDAINTNNLVVLGAYSCDQNSVNLIDPENGDLFHSFNADLAGRGIYINPVDFDKDGLTDIATGGIGQGIDMLIYNTNREVIGKIISNGDDQGVLIAFGDVDADQDFEIMVTNQSADDTVNLYESDGTAVRALQILQGKNKINIATGDVDGDGKAELIVVLADNATSDNVFIFDEQGNLINSFQAIPNENVTTKGLNVAVADINSDGKAEIIVTEAQAQSAYGVAVYNNSGELQNRFNAFSGSEDGTINPTADTCGNPYQGKGLLISTGDVNGDNQADIIVARAGYRQVKLFKGDGEFIDWFNALPEGYQITGLGFGEHMGVKVPLTQLEDIADTNAPLENITVIGQPNAPRPEITDREIRGTVRVANVLIVNITINIGAQLIPGPGTRFKHRSSIPRGQHLHHMCKKVKKTGKKHGHKIPKPIEVIDLSEPVVDQAPSVMEDIQVLVGADANARRALAGFGLRRAGNLSVTQDPTTGSILANDGTTLIEVMPVDLTQADINAPAGISLESNGTGQITTQQGQVVTVQATLHDLDAFIGGLETYLASSIDRLETDADGQLRLYLPNNETFYHVGRPHFFSEALGDRNLAVGIYDTKVLFPGLDQGVIFVFDDNQGVRRWQLILPTPADREALLALAETDSNIEAINLHFDVAEDTIPGSISFQIAGQRYQAIFDYLVRKGALPASGGVEFNRVDNNRYEVIYPNGDRQYLNLIQ